MYCVYCVSLCQRQISMSSVGQESIFLISALKSSRNTILGLLSSEEKKLRSYNYLVLPTFFNQFPQSLCAELLLLKFKDLLWKQIFSVWFICAYILMTDYFPFPSNCTFTRYKWLNVRCSDALYLCVHWFSPCREWVCGGLCCGAAAGLLCAGGGVGAGFRRGGRTQGLLTRRGATAAAAGGWGSARWRGWRRSVTGHNTATALQPIWRQLDFVWEKMQSGRRTKETDERVTYW